MLVRDSVFFIILLLRSANKMKDLSDLLKINISSIIIINKFLQDILQLLTSRIYNNLDI